MISWKVHSKEFRYAKRCNTNWNRWPKQRQEIGSNLGTYNNSVFSVASVRILGSSVSAGGLGQFGSPKSRALVGVRFRGKASLAQRIKDYNNTYACYSSLILTFVEKSSLNDFWGHFFGCSKVAIDK